MLYTIGFALVLAVLACVAVVLLMLRVYGLMLALESTSLKVKELDSLKAKSMPAVVTAELDSMRAALAMMAQSNARQFGSINARMRKPAAEAPTGDEFQQQRRLDQMLGLPSLAANDDEA